MVCSLKFGSFGVFEGEKGRKSGSVAACGAADRARFISDFNVVPQFRFFVVFFSTITELYPVAFIYLNFSNTNSGAVGIPCGSTTLAQT